MDKYITVDAVLDVLAEVYATAEGDAQDAIHKVWERVKALPDADVVERAKWISAEEPPENDRNIFIAHGSESSKAPCIGHYDAGMKLFYEDRNWFATPIYDALYWCEMPRLPLPEPPKEAHDERTDKTR